MRRRTRLMCHCEEQSDVAISGRHLRLVQAIADRTHLVGGGVLDAPPRNGTIFAGDFPVIRPGTAKLHPKGTSSRFALRALLLRQYMHNTEIAVTMRLSTILKTIKQPL